MFQRQNKEKKRKEKEIKSAASALYQNKIK